MPFYEHAGETRYIFQGTEYSGYRGPGDLVGVSGEYAPGSQFNTGPGGIDTSPRHVDAFPDVSSRVRINPAAGSGGIAADIAGGAPIRVLPQSRPGVATLAGPSGATTTIETDDQSLLDLILARLRALLGVQ